MSDEDETMRNWIAFEEQKPEVGEEIEVACHDKAGPCTVRYGSGPVHPEGIGRRLVEWAHNWTHWRHYNPPTDLPPKPLPKLPEGWKFEPVGGWQHAIFRDGYKPPIAVWIHGESVSVDCQAFPVPLKVIDALREANKR